VSIDRFFIEPLAQRLRAAWRAFVLGPYVVEPADRAWGHPIEEYAPEEYGKYIATSNGVYVCATQRAQFLASLPLNLYKGKANGDDVLVESGRAYDLLSHVNPFWTQNRLLTMTELSLCLWGQCFWFLERGESGKQPPREIWWGRPDRVRVVPHPENYIEAYLYSPLTGAMPVAYNASEVIWIRYPNPMDEYAPLSPISAARLAADYASAAMKSNRNLMDNGLQIGGLVAPKSGQTFTQDQAETIEKALERRFKGVDKAHRWGVFRFDAEIAAASKLGFNPKEAEFLGGLKLALEEICRAYKWPLDLVGGQRTYENVNAALKAAWTNCVLPEADFLANEITEQLLPMFPGEVDYAAFDSVNIDVLQEERQIAWQRDREMITVGRKTINEVRKENGEEPLPWGDVWWASATLLPVSDGKTEAPPAATEKKPAETTPSQDGGTQPRAQMRAIEYNSAEHQRIWNRFARRASGHEKQVTRTAVYLFRRQQESVIARLKAPARDAGTVVEAPFEMAQWVKTFRVEMRPVLASIVETAGQDALDDLNVTQVFQVAEPAVVRFLEGRTQRFAQRVNETTWERLKSQLREGIDAGENIPQLEARVIAVMEERIRSTPETIARTEVVGALNGGTLEAWRQSDVVETKVWMATLDPRVRDTHLDAHGQERKLDEDFEVGSGRGPAPGQIGRAEEDINCRCTMAAGIRGA